jgi:type II secretory pathway pseudopilin PulG
MAKFSQRGALFGMDARLALAIFTLLGLVVGYLAFGRIATARQAALLSQLQSISEALAAYQTDMGTFYLFTLDKDANDTDSTGDIAALWDNSHLKPGFKPHWNGPYLHRASRKMPPYGVLTLFYATGDRKDYCSTTSDCYVWLSLSSVPAETWKEINRITDEGGGNYQEPAGEDIARGLVQSDADTDPRALYYRTVARPAS